MTTTYRAIATRDGRWWSVAITGLPPEMIAYTQGRDLDDAAAMAREGAALLLNVPEEEVAIDLVVEGAEELLAEVAAARREREAAARAEQETLTRAAKELTTRGLTQRDTAKLLGLSAQRVSQLAPKRAG